MAIVLQEERPNGSGIVSIIVWIVILGVIGAAIYYVFFKNPEIVATKTPSGFANTAQLSKIQLDPNEVLSSPQFQGLRPYVPALTPKTTGRANPFLGF